MYVRGTDRQRAKRPKDTQVFTQDPWRQRIISRNFRHSIFKITSFMAGLSFDVLRVGKKYRLINFGESHEFEIERILADGDFKVKDLITLERYQLKELVRYGTGKDFILEELIPT
jgi:hypothetical protein